MKRLLPLVFIAVLASCGSSLPPLVQGPGPTGHPALRFAVISDPHLYDPIATGSRGEDWREILDRSGKNISSAGFVLSSVLAQIAADRPDFVLVPGDLSSDGEYGNLQAIARMFAALEAEGIPVYVVPGNHDILNPHNRVFDGPQGTRGRHVTPQEFEAIFYDFGPGEAISRDSASLSWLARPREGLSLFGIDSTDTARNLELGHPRTGGSIREASRTWLKTQMNLARERGDEILVFQHHGIIQHFEGQAQWLPQYLLDEHENLARLYAHFGVRLVFTGHGHAQDIASRTYGPHILYDVETGSLAGWPFPWRQVEMEPRGPVRIQSHFFAADWLAGRTSADPKAALALYQKTLGTITDRARDGLKRFPFSEEERSILAPWGAGLLMGHFAGNEGRFRPEQAAGGGESGGTQSSLTVPHRPQVGILGSLVFGIMAPTVKSLEQDASPDDHDLVLPGELPGN